MSDIEAAIDRIFNAQTAADLEKIFIEEPELFTPQADQVLAERQSAAEQQGNADMVAALVQLRAVLKSIRITAGVDLPDLPGSSSAADFIHALIAADPDAPVPALALSNVFFAALDALRDHARRNELTPMLENLRRLDQRIDAAGGIEHMAGHGRESIFSLIEEWVDVPTWIDSHGFLTDHSELLTPDALAIVSLLARGARVRESTDEADVLDQHAAILSAARAGRLEETYIAIIEAERSQGTDE
jgi:hypothetical protein